MKLRSVIAIFGATLVLSGCSTSTPAVNDATWSKGACDETTAGVTVSVDFKGQVSTHCAISYQGDSWKLLKAAGFEVRGTNKYPTAFACTIDGLPKTAKCDGSDPVNAYWAYFIASGTTYDYATSGASDHQTACGSTEAWVYTETETANLANLPAPQPITCN